MVNPNNSWIFGAMSRLGHEYFTGPYNVNIIGVRMNEYRVNKFDDFLFLIFQDRAGRWMTKQYEITTRPGLKMLKNPPNPDGVAILVPNQYRGVYKIDLHAGKYPALCQRLGPVEVYRDNDLDDEFDMEFVEVQEGYFGINIHKAGVDSENVDGWSAGCQVFKRKRDFDDFMHWIRVSQKMYGEAFSYTLLTEDDLNYGYSNTM